MNADAMIATASTTLAAFGMKIAGALLAWVVGRFLIGLAVRMVTGALTQARVDPTLLRYLGNIIGVTLNVVLVVAILGYFGVETTTFAALVAAMGIAIAAAWAGLLANFAAGAFLIVLRPFKAGDYVKAGGLEGTISEIGLFGTTIVTPDNVVSFVGNNKLFSDAIHNYSVNAYRRVELRERVSPRRLHRPARAFGRHCRGHSQVAGGPRRHPECPAGAGPRRGDHRFYRAWARARRAALYPHRQLLAGLLRHEPSDRRHIWPRGLSHTGRSRAGARGGDAYGASGEPARDPH
jgi:hypothetical protein